MCLVGPACVADDECEAGTRGCPCSAEGGCASSDLTCIDDVCVNEGAGGGGSASTSSTSSGSTSVCGDPLFHKSPFSLGDAYSCADCPATHGCAHFGLNYVPYCYFPCTTNADCACDTSAPECSSVSAVQNELDTNIGTWCHAAF